MVSNGSVDHFGPLGQLQSSLPPHRRELLVDDFLLQIFKDQVMIQSHYFIASWREFAITIFEGDDPKVAGTTPASKPRKNFSIERAFYSVQNCLNSAANMSKVFLGSERKTRGATEASA